MLPSLNELGGVSVTTEEVKHELSQCQASIGNRDYWGFRFRSVV